MYWPVDEELVIDTDLTVLQPASKQDIAAEDIVNTAVKSMPSVLIARNQRDNAFYSLRTAKWQFLPTLGLYGGWSTSYYTYPGQSGYTPVPYGRQFRNNGGEYLQLSLTIPIYDRLSKHTALAKSAMPISGRVSNMTNHCATWNRKSAVRCRTGMEQKRHCCRRKGARKFMTRHSG